MLAKALPQGHGRRGLDSTSSSTRREGARSDAEGRYDLRQVPIDLPVLVRARTKRGEAGERRLFASGAASFDLVCRPADASSIHDLRGIVLMPDGRRAAGAFVAAAQASTRANEDGEFRLERVALEETSAIAAWMPGYAAVEEVRLLAALRSGRSMAQAIVLRLPGPARSLRGQIVDERGIGVAHAWIAIDDPALLADSFTPIESRVGEQDRALLSTAEGRFEIRGLGQRSYRLRIWSKDGVPLLVSADIPPTAQDVRLVIEDVGTRLGRVVDVEGKGLAKARLALEFRTFANRSGAGTIEETALLTTCDDSGDFIIVGCPKRLGVLIVEAADGSRSRHPLAGLPTNGPLRLLHVSRRFVQVLVDAELRGDVLEVVDAEGLPVDVRLHQDNTVRQASRMKQASTGEAWIELPPSSQAVQVLSAEGEVSARASLSPDGGVLWLR